jgi:2-oxoacid:acceptor oxidoreductase gamma subunit (pyruvate/2-ketoisovalerate family)/2-oxoacid:acceptor oxidoreductase delta subunit (pyruvate/2-ketoisovalerate family)
MEIRLHGRGGQGGVTCAKILASVYAKLGKSIQTFGDYASERSGAPVRAYTRVDDQPITNRNKVYHPDHLLVLDPTLLGDLVLQGLRKGGSLLLNSPEDFASFDGRFEHYRFGLVDATAIARRHGIGTRSVVIINTTIAGAYAKMHGIPLDVLQDAYAGMGLSSNFAAAKEAYDAVEFREVQVEAPEDELSAAPLPKITPVEALEEHTESKPTGLLTGSWGTQMPHYVESLAPCSAWCPAGNDVIGFVRAVATDGAEKAAEILGRSTPLASVCGRVCPAPCQEGCNRAEYDGSVQIRGLERWVAAQVPVATKEKATHPNPKRVAIIGSGPAGIGAAYELAKLGHAVTIFEAEDALGGVLRTGIPSYRLDRAALDQEIDNVLALGVEARTGVRVEGAELQKISEDFDGVIVATGLQSLRSLGVPGEELEGVEQGIHFLHRLNMTGKVEAKGNVVVLGGGNTAMDCARSALRAGAAHVTIAYRRSETEMPAIHEERHEAKAEGIEFAVLRQPMGFYGNGRVQELELAEVELGEPDETGRRSPVVTDRTRRIPADHVLMALGQSADVSFLPSDWALDGMEVRNGKALPVVAAGDLATGEGTVTHAIGSGRRAAGMLLQKLGEPGVQVFARPSREEAVPYTEIRTEHFERKAPSGERIESARTRVEHFDEVNHGLEGPEEANRCFSCGHCTMCDTCLVYCPEGIVRREPNSYEIDYSFCKGCGICVEECPRRALEMVHK